MSFAPKLTIFTRNSFPSSISRTSITIRTHKKTNLKGSDSMYFGSKGWYVKELKKLGIRTYEGKKLESYRTHVLASLLERVQRESA